jgi:hypothetical protein
MLPLVDVVAVCAGAAVGPIVDTSYGRLDGDSAFVVEAGAAFDVRGVRGAIDVRYRYLQSAGIFLGYEEGFGGGAEPLRLALAGFELRPLFLGRFLKGMEIGWPRLDLLIDSIGFEVGAFVAQPAFGNFGSSAGLSFGLGAEFPLLPQATTPFIAVRAALRWSREALSAADSTTVDVRAFVVTVTFGFQGIFGGHVVDVGDVRR